MTIDQDLGARPQGDEPQQGQNGNEEKNGRRDRIKGRGRSGRADGHTLWRNGIRDRPGDWARRFAD